MKKIFTLLLASFAYVAIQAQDAQVYLTFENDEIIPEGVTGVTNVNGSGDVVIKNDGTYAQSDNTIIDDGGENVLFMDYHGYLKFDNTIFNKDAFTIIADYKWYGNNIWWLGLHTIIGYDAEAETPGYVSKQLQIKQPAGNVDGWGVSTSALFTKDTYHHFALTYDMGIIKLYIDGVEAANNTDQTLHSLQNPELYFGIKMNVDGATGEVSPSLDGSSNCKSVKANADNVGLFNRALTAQEVAAIANKTSVPTDVEEVNNNTVKLYPNPCTDVLHIASSEVVSVEVYNMAGSKLLAVRDVNGVVDMTAIVTGVYMVKMLNKQGEVIAVSKVVRK
ncbi:LamG-like jellyroll fold domain-containing protein [Saccharicrinis sp. GN24d3]|uniref:LamG-like jellyroll fold domain-containing protein n=1 Tax=Saccharicrinis sp. GN24d3 TaxID=3458416 RepID=UPI00403692E6